MRLYWRRGQGYAHKFGGTFFGITYDRESKRSRLYSYRRSARDRCNLCKGTRVGGGKLVVSDINDPSSIAGEIESNGGEAIAVQSDVSDWQSCQDMVSAATDRFGRVDVLINNAAVFGKLDRASIDEITPELFHQVISVNVMNIFV